MIKARFGADLDRIVRTVFPFVAHLRVHPDVLTLIGAAAAGLAAWAFAVDRPVTAGLLLMASGFFDLVDGVVARQQGRSSIAGAFFDSTVDRLSDLLIFSGIVVGAAARADTTLAALALWALGGSVLTSYTRASAERRLASLHKGILERAERFVIVILGALSGFLQAAVLLVAIGSTVTAIQRTLEARRLLRILEETGIDPTRDGDAVQSAEAAASEEVRDEGRAAG